MKIAGVALGLLCLGGCAAAATEPVAEPQAKAPQVSVEPARLGFSFEGPMQQGSLVLGHAPSGTAALTLDGKPVPIDAMGRFVVGFDRDHPGAAILSAQLRNGRTVTESLRIAPRSWKIEHVDVAQRPGTSSAEFLRIRGGELARINAARAVNATSDGWRQRFIWPVRGRISGVFGSQRIYRGEPGPFHTGVDIAPGAGAPVVAPADGVVVLAGPPMFSLEGNLVIIDHGLGLNSAFLHLASSNVREGQPVKQGHLIGTVGASGRATGPHLHWSMKWRDARVDPQILAGPMNEQVSGRASP